MRNKDLREAISELAGLYGNRKLYSPVEWEHIRRRSIHTIRHLCAKDGPEEIAEMVHRLEQENPEVASKVFTDLSFALPLEFLSTLGNVRSADGRR